MSGPPDSTAPPAAPPASPPGPPPGYPPYPPYPPYPWYPQPPRRDNTVLIVVIVVVILVVVPVVFSAILYVMVSGLIRGPQSEPRTIWLGPVDQANGNSTIRIVPGSSAFPPTAVRFVVAANGSASSIVAAPPPNGSVTIVSGAYTLRVFWVDDDVDGLVGGHDLFLVTGNLRPLPPSTSFSFTLLINHGTGAAESTISWSTP